MKVDLAQRVPIARVRWWGLEKTRLTDKDIRDGAQDVKQVAPAREHGCPD